MYGCEVVVVASKASAFPRDEEVVGPEYSLTRAAEGLVEVER